VTSAPLSPSERRDRLRLARTERVGPVAFRDLMIRYGDAARVLEALPILARRGGGPAPRGPTPAQAEDEIAQGEAWARG
jgi:DNA processing protein